MKGKPGYFIEESGDELNDETFGDLNDDMIAKPDFEFGGKSLAMPAAPDRPPSLGSSPSTGRRGLTAAELEQQFIPQRSPLQGVPIPGLPKRNVVMNLDELESSFKASASISNVASLGSSFPSARPMSPPPGLVPGLVKAPKPIPTITFPDPENDEDEVGSTDPNRYLMSKYEREGIRHIHMAQLTTENPMLEDFYYQAFSKRSLKNQNQSNGPLYLPLPNLKKKQVTKQHMQNYEGALGKFSSSSSRKPRQQLQVDLDKSPTIKLETEDISSEELFFSVLGTVEKVYDSVFKLEDVLDQGDDTEYDAQVADQTKKDTRSTVTALLHLEDERQWGRVEILRFVHMLSLPKGRKAIFRAIRLLDTSFSRAFLARLIECLEYLTVFRPNTAVVEIESFVNLVLSPLVPFVSEAPASFIVDTIKSVMAKSSFLWLFFSRPGIILMCILISRIEICKSAFGGVSEADPVLGVEWPLIGKQLFDLISDRLLDFFNIPTLRSATAAKGTFDGGDYYIWQLMALVALNVDADAKKTMIMELRDKIMSVVQHGSPKDTQNLNIFLNVLGLDSSQLAA